jgi:membrane protein
MFAYFRVPVRWIDIVKRTIRAVMEDDCIGLAAQLAFYFLLALVPTLIVVVALLTQLPAQHTLERAVTWLAGVAPPDVVSLLVRELEALDAVNHGGLLTVSILGAVWTSSIAMMAIISALNDAYNITDRRPWIVRRALAIGLTLVLAVFVIAAQVLLLVGPFVAAWVTEHTGMAALEYVWLIGRWPLVLLLVLLAVDVVYYAAPDADTDWVWITPGSLVATTLWLIASAGFSWYVQNLANFTATYGTLGGFIVVMLWCYLAGLAILVGAELNAEIDRASPYRQEVEAPASGRPRIGPAAERAHRERWRAWARFRLPRWPARDGHLPVKAADGRTGGRSDAR